MLLHLVSLSNLRPSALFRTKVFTWKATGAVTFISVWRGNRASFAREVVKRESLSLPYYSSISSSAARSLSTFTLPDRC